MKDILNGKSTTLRDITFEGVNENKIEFENIKFDHPGAMKYFLKKSEDLYARNFYPTNETMEKEGVFVISPGMMNIKELTSESFLYLNPQQLYYLFCKKNDGRNDSERVQKYKAVFTEYISIYHPDIPINTIDYNDDKIKKLSGFSFAENTFVEIAGRVSAISNPNTVFLRLAATIFNLSSTNYNTEYKDIDLLFYHFLFYVLYLDPSPDYVRDFLNQSKDNKLFEQYKKDILGNLKDFLNWKKIDLVSKEIDDKDLKGMGTFYEKFQTFVLFNIYNSVKPGNNDSPTAIAVDQSAIFQPFKSKMEKIEISNFNLYAHLYTAIIKMVNDEDLRGARGTDINLDACVVIDAINDFKKCQFHGIEYPSQSNLNNEDQGDPNYKKYLYNYTFFLIYQAIASQYSSESYMPVEMCAQTFFRNVNDAEIKFMDKICDDLFLRTYTPLPQQKLNLYGHNRQLYFRAGNVYKERDVYAKGFNKEKQHYNIDYELFNSLFNEDESFYAEFCNFIEFCNKMCKMKAEFRKNKNKNKKKDEDENENEKIADVDVYKKDIINKKGFKKLYSLYKSLKNDYFNKDGSRVNIEVLSIIKSAVRCIFIKNLERKSSTPLYYDKEQTVKEQINKDMQILRDSIANHGVKALKPEDPLSPYEKKFGKYSNVLLSAAISYQQNQRNRNPFKSSGSQVADSQPVGLSVTEEQKMMEEYKKRFETDVGRILKKEISIKHSYGHSNIIDSDSEDTEPVEVDTQNLEITLKVFVKTVSNFIREKVHDIIQRKAIAPDIKNLNLNFLLNYQIGILYSISLILSLDNVKDNKSVDYLHYYNYMVLTLSVCRYHDNLITNILTTATDDASVSQNLAVLLETSPKLKDVAKILENITGNPGNIKDVFIDTEDEKKLNINVLENAIQRFLYYYYSQPKKFLTQYYNQFTYHDEMLTQIDVIRKALKKIGGDTDKWVEGANGLNSQYNILAEAIKKNEVPDWNPISKILAEIIESNLISLETIKLENKDNEPKERVLPANISPFDKFLRDKLKMLKSKEITQDENKEELSQNEKIVSLVEYLLKKDYVKMKNLNANANANAKPFSDFEYFMSIYKLQGFSFEEIKLHVEKSKLKPDEEDKFALDFIKTIITPENSNGIETLSVQILDIIKKYNKYFPRLDSDCDSDDSSSRLAFSQFKGQRKIFQMLSIFHKIKSETEKFETGKNAIIHKEDPELLKHRHKKEKLYLDLLQAIRLSKNVIVQNQKITFQFYDPVQTARVKIKTTDKLQNLLNEEMDKNFSIFSRINFVSKLKFVDMRRICSKPVVFRQILEDKPIKESEGAETTKNRVFKILTGSDLEDAFSLFQNITPNDILNEGAKKGKEFLEKIQSMTTIIVPDYTTTKNNLNDFKSIFSKVLKMETDKFETFIERKDIKSYFSAGTPIKIKGIKEILDAIEGLFTRIEGSNSTIFEVGFQRFFYGKQYFKRNPFRQYDRNGMLVVDTMYRLVKENENEKIFQINFLRHKDPVTKVEYYLLCGIEIKPTNPYHNFIKSCFPKDECQILTLNYSSGKLSIIESINHVYKKVRELIPDKENLFNLNLKEANRLFDIKISLLKRITGRSNFDKIKDIKVSWKEEKENFESLGTDIEKQRKEIFEIMADEATVDSKTKEKILIALANIRSELDKRNKDRNKRNKLKQLDYLKSTIVDNSSEESDIVKKIDNLIVDLKLADRIDIETIKKRLSTLFTDINTINNKIVQIIKEVLFNLDYLEFLEIAKKILEKDEDKRHTLIESINAYYRDIGTISDNQYLYSDRNRSIPEQTQKRIKELQEQPNDPEQIQKQIDELKKTKAPKQLKKELDDLRRLITSCPDFYLHSSMFSNSNFQYLSFESAAISTDSVGNIFIHLPFFITEFKPVIEREKIVFGVDRGLVEPLTVAYVGDTNLIKKNNPYSQQIDKIKFKFESAGSESIIIPKQNEGVQKAAVNKKKGYFKSDAVDNNKRTDSLTNFERLCCQIYYYQKLLNNKQNKTYFKQKKRSQQDKRLNRKITAHTKPRLWSTHDSRGLSKNRLRRIGRHQVHGLVRSLIEYSKSPNQNETLNISNIQINIENLGGYRPSAGEKLAAVKSNWTRGLFQTLLEEKCQNESIYMQLVSPAYTTVRHHKNPKVPTGAKGFLIVKVKRNGNDEYLVLNGFNKFTKDSININIIPNERNDSVDYFWTRELGQNQLKTMFDKADKIDDGIILRFVTDGRGNMLRFNTREFIGRDLNAPVNIAKYNKLFHILTSININEKRIDEIFHFNEGKIESDKKEITKPKDRLIYYFKNLIDYLGKAKWYNKYTVANIKAGAKICEDFGINKVLNALFYCKVGKIEIENEKKKLTEITLEQKNNLLKDYKRNYEDKLTIAPGTNIHEFINDLRNAANEIGVSNEIISNFADLTEIYKEVTFLIHMYDDLEGDFEFDEDIEEITVYNSTEK